MSAKIVDKKNRWRSKTVGFRVSPEEWAEIERLVKLSGMTKQEYIMHRLQNVEMVIQASPRVLKVIKNELQIIANIFIDTTDEEIAVIELMDLMKMIKID